MRAACFLASGSLVVALLASAACSNGRASGSPPAPPTAPATTSPDVFPFTIGALAAAALNDGDIEVPNDGKTVGVGQPVAAVTALLAAAGLATDAVHFPIQPLLVRASARILLFDTGAGDASFARAGRLVPSLRAAGVATAAVTDIFITHAHADHVGGLVTPAGALTYPAATIHISEPEWAAMQAEPTQATLVAAIGPKVVPFEPGTAILPEVTAVPVPGHTPGHSAYEIASGSDRLLYIGDTAHHFVISVQRPSWTIDFDPTDDAEAKAARLALLTRAAATHLRLYAVHFPFPGLGRVEARGDAFVWIPEPAAR